MILPFRTSTYARNIYLSGTTQFSTIPTEYVDPVKQYAADTYYIDDITNAADKGWITTAERDETLALKDENDPQYRPIGVFSLEQGETL